MAGPASLLEVSHHPSLRVALALALAPPSVTMTAARTVPSPDNAYTHATPTPQFAPCFELHFDACRRKTMENGAKNSEKHCKNRQQQAQEEAKADQAQGFLTEEIQGGGRGIDGTILQTECL